MDFKELRKQKDLTGIVKPETVVPEKSSKSGDEKSHQNDDLLDGEKEPMKKIWVPKKAVVKEDHSHVSHKVRVHFDGRSEVRYVDDAALDVLRKSKHITKVEHLGRMAGGKLLEYSLNELKETIHSYKNDEGDCASITTHKYADKGLGEDHYVQGKSVRTSMHSTKEKAHQKLISMGYKPSKENE